MKAYKIFNNDFTCNNFQYEVGKTYTCDNPVLCSSGFHACINPTYCLDYYSPIQSNKFAIVELDGIILGLEDKKQCANKITITKELSFIEFIEEIKSFTIKSEGINRSNGINKSDGINESFGINDSNSINGSLFVSKINPKSLFFNVEISDERMNTIKNKLTELLGSWTPTYNNLTSLYLKSGNDWKSTPIKNAKELQKKEAWIGMPENAIDFLKSQPEWDAQIFFEVTGMKILN